MQAIRRIEKVSGNSIVIALPDEFRHRRVEVIVLPADNERYDDIPSRIRREPPAHLLGKGKIAGDIIGPIIPISDWEGLK